MTKAQTLLPLILKATRLDGKEITPLAAMSIAEQLAADLSEIPDKWVAKCYEHARCHRRPVPRAIEVLKSWDHDIKSEAFAKPAAVEPIAAIAQPIVDNWSDLAAHRLLRRQGSGLPDAGGAMDLLIEQPPTKDERAGFLRMLGRSAQKDHQALADAWGERNPYGLTSLDIMQVMARNGVQDAIF
jgi:hypothetical protein